MMKANVPISELDAKGPWVKSSFSGQGGCLEVTRVSEGQVALRSSRAPEGVALVLSGGEWSALVAGVKAGEFDELS